MVITIYSLQAGITDTNVQHSSVNGLLIIILVAHDET